MSQELHNPTKKKKTNKTQFLHPLARGSTTQIEVLKKKLM
jgi:hypothetical protein